MLKLQTVKRYKIVFVLNKKPVYTMNSLQKSYKSYPTEKKLLGLHIQNIA